MVGSRALQEEHPSTPPPPPPPPSMVQCLKKDSKFSDCKRLLYKPDPRTTIGPTIYSFHLAGLKEAQKCNPVTHCSFCIHSSDKCPAVDKSIFVEHLQACHQKRCLNWQVEDTVSAHRLAAGLQKSIHSFILYQLRRRDRHCHGNWKHDSKLNRPSVCFLVSRPWGR